VGDGRILRFIDAAEDLKRGNFHIDVPLSPMDDIGRLGVALCDLASTLDKRYRELEKLIEITSHVNSGLLLEEILDQVYREFVAFIPYDRIGFSLLEDEGCVLRAFWARCNYSGVLLRGGYAASMAGSSLQAVLETRQPRILNDLRGYLEAKPGSESTRLVVQEGIQSSLTCPLHANGVPVGFIFFSSRQPNAYQHAHIETFQRIAEQLSVILEKGRLVSRLAEHKRAIEAQNEQLKRLNEVKNSLLGMAAHDLRNPIGSISLLAEFLLEPDADLNTKESRCFIEDIHAQSTYMLSLLNDLLDVAQIESGKLKITPVAFAVSDLLGEAVSRHAKLASGKRIRVMLDPVPGGEAQGDPFRLRQVLDNYISNAVKFSPPGSTVTVGASAGPGGWRVEVRDAGPGLTRGDQSHVFQDFVRLSARPTAGEKSTGLGLAITRRIIEAHGGRVGVDSEPGKGASFWFQLPK
jgi:signal transduction histidine kinase